MVEFGMLLKGKVSYTFCETRQGYEIRNSTQAGGKKELLSTGAGKAWGNIDYLCCYQKLSCVVTKTHSYLISVQTDYFRLGAIDSPFTRVLELADQLRQVHCRLRAHAIHTSGAWKPKQSKQHAPFNLK